MQIPDDLEVGYIPLSMGGAYPGLYLFTCPSRFVRPVRNVSPPPEESNDIELIGPFEQVYIEFFYISQMILPSNIKNNIRPCNTVSTA